MRFLKKQLGGIRASGEKEKKKWLVILSGAVMIIIIILWSLYMNSFVLGTTDQTQEKTIGVGFWPVFKTGLSITSQKAWGGIEDFFTAMFLKIRNLGEKKIEIQNQ